MADVFPAERASSGVSGPFPQALLVEVMQFAALQHGNLFVGLIVHQANLALMISLDRLAERLAAAESHMHSQRPMPVSAVLDHILCGIEGQGEGGERSEQVDLNVLVCASNNDYQH